ncbi:STP1 protein [Plasmodium malariae]|uniref:STP1 protein n=1 Tax=Plasmodium malariae TaxID=5858 RepID=A0A1D3JI21_PLAMA|nr:STP1 protein [Plasmodium malariae]SBT85984.1 STP1 protein [Plasmodium malariae]
MENCIPKNFAISGTAGFSLTFTEPFRTIRTHIQNRTKFLKTENNEDLFREECIKLADYLIGKMSPPKSISPTMWEALLKFYLNHYFKDLTKYGGCPMILKKEDKELLKLKYKEDYFCKKRRSDLNVIEIIRKRNSGKCENTCLTKCKEYNNWIKQIYNEFNEKRNLFESCYKIEPRKKTKKLTKESICDIMNEETFKELPYCLNVNSVESTEHLRENENKILPEKSQDTPQIMPKPQGQQEEHLKFTPATRDEQQPEISPESPVQHPPEDSQELLQHVSLETAETEASDMQDSTKETIDIQPIVITSLKTSRDPDNADITSAGNNRFPSPVIQETQASPSRKYTELTHQASSYTSVQFPLKNLHSTGNLKKNKKTRRRQVKFLRLLVPSFSKNKNKILIDDHLDQPIYDEKEIIKKIKINELTKNVNLSKQKKDRSKTIIEVHMEVLEECKNEEWETKKLAFLEICIKELEISQCTSSNILKNFELMQNIDTCSDNEKQKILWNELIEEHKNLSEKLKNEHWFNNMKKDWKREQTHQKKGEALNKEFSNQNKNTLLLEREKDLWRQWISKMHATLEHHLEQDGLRGLNAELHNVLDEYVNEETQNNVSLLNTEELKQKGCYKDLYKYIRKKLLAKMCILVFMIILEECKKEDIIENTESYFDSSINELKREVNLGKKTEIANNLIDTDKNVLENKENIDHKEEPNFRNEINDWTRDDDTYVNFIINDEEVNKSIDVPGKNTL